VGRGLVSSRYCGLTSGAKLSRSYGADFMPRLGIGRQDLVRLRLDTVDANLPADRGISIARITKKPQCK
jgi:hypothetical protein